MIAVDTSALMAILLNEDTADSCSDILESADHLLMSSTTLAEALIVADRRDLGEEMRQLVGGLDVEIVNVTATTARRVADVYGRWGKGIHHAALNLGDCFAYDVASEHDCPLLFVGTDFARTDVVAALPE
jgi:ribonuclease VapC